MPYATSGSNITSASQIANGVITNDHINASAAIVYSKLSLADSILNADINSAAAIVRSKLAAPITAAVSKTSEFSTTSTTFVDVTGLTSGSITVKNVPHLVFANLVARGSAACEVEYNILEDSTEIARDRDGSISGVNFMSVCPLAVLRTPTAAAHTYKVQALVTTGTLTVCTTGTSVISTIGVVELS